MACSRFDGQGVIVTGGAQGIGQGIVQAFLEEGAKVVIADMNADRAGETARALQEQHQGRVMSVECNVIDEKSVAEMVAKAIDFCGHVDVLVNNAGTVTMCTVAEMTEAEWDQVMDVNVKGVFLCSRAIIPHMTERKKGNIISISSQAGKRGYGLFVNYCASKAAVIGFTRALAVEVCKTGIRVNAVDPGTVATPMMEMEYGWITERTGKSRDESEQAWIEAVPLGRLQTPRDMANACMFLASDEAAMFTGQSLNVDGGMVMD